MFGGKLQLRVRTKQWPVRLGPIHLVRREGARVAYLLGKGPQAYLRSAAPGLADAHCWICWDGVQVSVVPCDGQLVYINGVETRSERPLLSGDTLQVGDLVLRLVRVGSAVTEPAAPDNVARRVHQTDDIERIADEVLLGESPSNEESARTEPMLGKSILDRLVHSDLHTSGTQSPASPLKPQSDTGKAADEALTRLFRRRLAEQKRVEAKPPRRLGEP